MQCVFENLCNLVFSLTSSLSCPLILKKGDKMLPQQIGRSPHTFSLVIRKISHWPFCHLIWHIPEQNISQRRFPAQNESLAVSCKTFDRDCRSQSLIFFEQYYYLTVKLMPQIRHEFSGRSIIFS